MMIAIGRSFRLSLALMTRRRTTLSGTDSMTQE
jgi:hypothetical protein